MPEPTITGHDSELESPDRTLAPGMVEQVEEDPFGGAGDSEPDTDVGMTTQEMGELMGSIMQPAPAPPPKRMGKPVRKPAMSRNAGVVRRGTTPTYKPGSKPTAMSRVNREHREETDFPYPPTRHFKDENNKADCKGNGFFKFWEKMVAEGFGRRIMVYVYRIWPVMREGHRQAGKLVDPIQMDDLVRLYGVGDFNLKLNDAGNGYASVCQCTIKNVGERDMSTNPPILDPLGLETEDPLNKSYLVFLRSRGELKTEGSEDDMANAEIVREMASSNRMLTNKLLERSERPPEIRQDTDSNAAMRGMEIVQNAAMRSQEMIDRTVQRTQELSQTQGDPMGMIDRTFTLVKSLLPQPGQGADSGVVEVMKLMMERDKGYYDRFFQMQAEQIRKLEESVQSKQIQTQAAERPKTLLEQLSEMGAVKDKLRDIMGIDGEEKEAKAGWTDHIPAILQGVALLGTVIVSASHNLAVARTGQGTAIQPPLPENVLTQEQQLAAQAGHTAGLSGQIRADQDQPPPAQPLTNQFAQAQAEAARAQILKQEGGLQTMTQFHGFFKLIQVPLLRSFQEGDSGAEFASKLIELGDNGFFGADTSGQQIYEMVTQYGIMLVGMAIKTYPPIWGVVSLTPGKWDQFLGEFFKAPEIWDREDREEEDRGLRDREEAVRTAQAQVRPGVQQAIQEDPGASGGVQTPGQAPTAAPSPAQAQDRGSQTTQGKRPRT